MTSGIQLIALDLDGTLLNDDGSLSERNVQAIQTAVARSVQVILATGKSRASADHVLARLGLATPGVYNQGLVIHNADGSIRQRTVMDKETAVRAITFAVENNLPHHAYCGTRIVAPYDNPYRRRLHDLYHEPLAEIIGPFLEQIDNLSINKFLISDEVNNDTTRARLAALMGERAVVTQAVSGFIEMLPPGASKGRGVQRLLDDMGISPAAMLAVGDGENDVEMLQMAGIGVAMGNAKPAVQAIADFVTADNNQSGVAAAIERFVLNGNC